MPGGRMDVNEMLRAPKRRVAVRVDLLDHSTLSGSLYADVRRLDGSRGSVADRLHHPYERYVPLATEGKHLLLNKSKIVTVALTEGEDAPPLPRLDGLREFEVQIGLFNGKTLRGTIFAILPPSNSRVLDFLNSTGHQFISVVSTEGVTLVNTDYIVGVSEIVDDA